jgi:hypothetical protein
MSDTSYSPSTADRRKVEYLAGRGLGHSLIAKRIGITETELHEHFKKELKIARAKMNAKVGATLFGQAKAGDIKAVIFWLKTRAGWSETIHREISLAQATPPAPPKQDPIIILPCNTRNPCPRGTPERMLIILERLLKEALERQRNQLLN